MPARPDPPSESSGGDSGGRARQPSSGTRPEGTRDEREAARFVREMFGHIAPRYDFLNHLLSFSLDRVWRRRTARRFRRVLCRPDAAALDVCCGTGDMTLALAAVAGFSGAARIWGVDFSGPMIEIARAKNRRARSKAAFFAADGMALPFRDASFDLVTAAFGFRNLANYRRGLEEFARVLRPGGEIALLEFSEAEKGVAAALARFYMKRVLPRVGGAISGNAAAYSYLPGSVSRFPSPRELALWMDQAGFANVAFEIWNLGTVALHTGRRL